MIHENRDKINFYMCDCIEFMKSKPDKCYDLAIVDPPYGIGVNHNMGRRKGQKSSGYKKAYWDNEPPPIEYFEELFRVSKNQIIWGANHFIQSISASGNNTNTPCWLMWNKGFSEEVTFAQFELAWTSFKSTCKKYDKSPNQLDRTHPTQKPIDLYRKTLVLFATKGMKILDTHGGSMTIARACDMEGFALDICEIDEEYFNNGLKAFDNYKRQLTLF